MDKPNCNIDSFYYFKQLQSILCLVTNLSIPLLVSAQSFTLLASKDPFYRATLYKPNYIMPYQYIVMEDEDGSFKAPKPKRVTLDRLQTLISPTLDEFTFDEFKYSKTEEIAFQISIKIPLLQFKPSDTRCYLAYTQYSCWQAYTGKSAFFRESNFNPELFIEKSFTTNPHKNLQIETLKFAFIHQSNGRGTNFERSWNRIYADLVLKLGKRWNIILTPWYILPTKDVYRYNPDIADYLGYGQVALHFENDFFNFTLQKQIKSYQVMAIFPVSPSLQCVIRYFEGYGSTLGMYKQFSQSFGIGFGVRY